MRPIVDGIEEKYNGQIPVKRINADVGDGPAIMRTHRIQGHPTTLIFDHQGQEVHRFFGPQATGAVEAVLDDTIAAEP